MADTVHKPLSREVFCITKPEFYSEKAITKGDGLFTVTGIALEATTVSMIDLIIEVYGSR